MITSEVIKFYLCDPRIEFFGILYRKNLITSKMYLTTFLKSD